MEKQALRRIATREIGLLTALLLLGLVVLPIAIYKVGQLVFGAYAGHGFADFYGDISSRLRSGDFYAWFLMLSPWLGVQALRLMAYAWRKSAPAE